MLSLRDISSGYGAVSVVKSVTLSVRPGEIVALLGKNGMGKSTLLKTILGLVPLRGGAIQLGGADQAALTPARMIAWGLSYVPQEQPLFQDLSIRDNLRLAVRTDGELAAGARARLRLFPVPQGQAQAARRHAVGRRTEDADPRPRPDASAAPAADR